MDRTLRLALNNFVSVPNFLRQDPAVNAARADIVVDLASLYHHYYLDSYGRTPPDPDPVQFEYLKFVLPAKEFRLSGDGIGISTAKRRHSSNELGQAFCRKVLHDHLNITYFAHLERVLDRSLHPAFSALRLERAANGDAPDYFCAESVDAVFLAEAKGRYSPVSFGNQDFGVWRNQFERVVIKNSSGVPVTVKGFIVATRFACEKTPRVKSTLFAEDPETRGASPIGELGRELAAIIAAIHYGGIALKIGQPILASALFNGFAVGDEIRFPTMLWQLEVGPLHGTRFVGGYYPSLEGVPALQFDKDRVFWRSADPLRLDVGTGTFVGLEESIFKALVANVRAGLTVFPNVRRLETIAPFYSGVSMLRDGSTLGPLEFFRPLGQVVL